MLDWRKEKKLDVYKERQKPPPYRIAVQWMLKVLSAKFVYLASQQISGVRYVVSQRDSVSVQRCGMATRLTLPDTHTSFFLWRHLLLAFLLCVNIDVSKAQAFTGET